MAHFFSLLLRPWMALVLIAAISSGCPPCDPEDPQCVRALPLCDGVLQADERYVDSHFDVDRDGTFRGEGCDEFYDPEFLDCDDTDGAINPQAAELVCDGIDNDCDPSTPDVPDVDGDLYPDCGTVELDARPAGMLGTWDCDDANPAVNPGAAEIECTNADEDCDPSTLDAPDGDEDGASVCVDCDDADPRRSPHFSEVTCNGIDDDCRVITVDEADLDGDGVGFCTDCDDKDPWRSPDRSEDLCNGIDDDCDATTPDTEDVDGDNATVCVDCDDEDEDRSPYFAEVSCNFVDDDCDPLTPDSVDSDGDGISDCLDCDDFDPAVSPIELEELCNGLDDDCNPATADAVDQDGDGVSNCDDCEDLDPTISPLEAEQLCNGVDDDCDLQTEDAPDADGDDYTVCDDCDDTSFTVNPSIPEICGDAIDQNCDGLVEECDGSDLNDCSIQVLGSAAAQELGTSYAVGDIDGDGTLDIVVGAPRFDTGAQVNDDIGGVFVLYGPIPTGVQHDLADPAATGLVTSLYWGEMSGDLAGTAVAVGDFNGDGDADIAVGMPGSEAGSADETGAVALLWGPLPPGDADVLTIADVVLEGSRRIEFLGETLRNVGDFDLDGADDLAIGAPQANQNKTDRGYTYLASSSALALQAGSVPILDVAPRVMGENGHDHLGQALASADVDGDGTPDLLVGAPNHQGQHDTAVWGFSGDYQATLDINSGARVANEADFSFLSNDPLDGFGTAVASAGDLAGNGYDSVLVGAPYGEIGGLDAAGAVYVFTDPNPGFPAAVTSSVTVLQGEALDQNFGQALAASGDINGDGIGDFLVGAAGAAGPDPTAPLWDTGLVQVVFGPLPAGAHAASSLATTTLPGLGSQSRVGEFLAPGGDFTGDGLTDVLVGAPGFDKGAGQAEAGALFVCAGSDF